MRLGQNQHILKPGQTQQIGHLGKRIYFKCLVKYTTEMIFHAGLAQKLHQHIFGVIHTSGPNLKGRVQV